MKKRAEIAVAALAVMFICFAIGYFSGRRSLPSEVSISTGTVVVTPAIIESRDSDPVAHAAESVTPATSYSPVSATPAPTPPVETPDATSELTVTPPPPPEQTMTEEAAPQPAGEPHYTADGLLRINLATQKELETLPGIGEVIASRIVEYRTQNGPFSKLSTLKVIKGIGDSRYNSIKDLVTVE